MSLLAPFFLFLSRGEICSRRTLFMVWWQLELGLFFTYPYMASQTKAGPIGEHYPDIATCLPVKQYRCLVIYQPFKQASQSDKLSSCFPCSSSDIVWLVVFVPQTQIIKRNSASQVPAFFPPLKRYNCITSTQYAACIHCVI